MSDIEYRKSQVVPREKLATYVADHLTMLILSGALRPGEHIRQDAIAEDLAVSRLPVREALIILEGEGLVETRPHRGAVVAQLTRRDILDHYEIYGRVHGMAAYRCAGELSDEDKEALWGLQESMALAPSADLAELNWEFHRIINHKGGTRRLRSVLRSLSRHIPSTFFTEIEESREVALRGHERILRSLDAGDAEAALIACINHLVEEGALVVAMMDERGFWDE